MEQTTTTVLKRRLAELAPELHTALERSWKIALEEWLPAIGTNMDSYNSYPHLRNLENYLDQVVTGFEAMPSARGQFQLRPVELYVLLAAILFHDLGRTQKNKEHSEVSRDSVVEKYANLGIPNQELARTVGRICAAHDPSSKRPKRGLYDTVIDPFGEVRQRPLVALLTLVDHMDGAYTRALREYVKETSKLEIIGLFRSAVTGIHADCEAQMIKVVLADMAGLDDFAATALLQGKRIKAPIGYSKQSSSRWPSPKLLAAVKHDVQRNAAVLKKIGDDLAVFGLPLRAWLIEHREHLYNSLGYETYEPVFDPGYLERIVKGMWDLSLSVFGCSLFTYEELAAKVWEPNVSKVRRAVRRISIVARKDDDTVAEAIWAGDSTWRWNKGRDKQPKQGDSLADLCSDIKKTIHVLKSPYPVQ